MSGAPVKHHAAINPILRGQDLALGHIKQKLYFIVLTLTIPKLPLLYIVCKSFGYGVMLVLSYGRFDLDAL